MEKYFRRILKRFVNKRINGQLNKILMLAILLFLFGVGIYRLGYLEDFQATVMKVVPQSAKIVSTTAKGMARVHFIDVGQGDGTLIQTGNKNILVDTGEDSHEEKLLGYLDTVGVDQLEYLILTHPDADHIGNASVLLQKMQVGKIIMPDKPRDTLSYKQVMSTIQDWNSVIEIRKPNQVYAWRNSTVYAWNKDEVVIFENNAKVYSLEED